MELDDKYANEIRYEFAEGRIEKFPRGLPYYMRRLHELIGMCRYGGDGNRRAVSDLCMRLNSGIFYGTSKLFSEVAIHTRNEGYLRDAIILYGIGYFEVDQLLRGAQIIAAAGVRIEADLIEMVRLESSYLSNESADRVRHFISPDIVRSPRIRIGEETEDGWLRFQLM